MASIVRLLAAAVLILLVCVPVKQGSKTSLIVTVSDIKDFKKILKTKTNVLVLFAKNEKFEASSMNILKEVAEKMKGKATIVFISCSAAKKLCKKLKVSTSTSAELWHYNNGDFNKVYDRKLTLKSMLGFLEKPTGEMPWEEDETAADVTHVNSPAEFYKILKKSKIPILVMFYAPWCGYCKRLKPDYAAAATEVKGQVMLIAADVDREEQMQLRVDFNITGFPTIYYLNGKMKFKYGGENSKDGIITWLKDPQPVKEEAKEAEWADEESEVVHLDDDSFETFVSEKPSVLVMFYAPWCGHCKKMKPDYTQAAAQMKEEKINGHLAAVDATKAKVIGEKFAISGFPTLKYFKNGEFTFDVTARTQDKIVEFMNDPKKPPPPPPEEVDWEEMDTEVLHLGMDSFKVVLKKKKHALVMFYAPWCGHCKKAKPEFIAAAARMKENIKVVYVAVDCTKHDKLCTSHEVSGYPTIKYFNYGKFATDYTSGRQEEDFVSFMADMSPSPPPKPSDKAPQADHEHREERDAEGELNEDWAGIAGAENVRFLSAGNFDKFITSHDAALVMFYAPWCGHCTAMKPAYAEAATSAVQQKIPFTFAAVDATQNKQLAKNHEVKGYPKLKYFRNGVFQLDYRNQRTVEDLLNFASSPPAPVQEEAPPDAADGENTVTSDWRDIEGAEDVKYLSEGTFDAFLASHEATLVMFYAPWCGHCKNMKPAYAEAATSLKVQEVPFYLAAVDVTVDKSLAERFGVTGFPTLKYFKYGDFKWDYKGARAADNFVKYAKNPVAPPPPDPEWHQVQSAVHHFTSADYDVFLEGHSATLVMFYAPWCGHCKKAKPFYQAAADQWAGKEDRQFAAIDCTKYKDVCQKNGVKGYPTILYFAGNVQVSKYSSGRTQKEFLHFIKNPPILKEEL